MFDNLSREESLKAINDKVKSINGLRSNSTIPHTERAQTISQLYSEIKDLWYHIYDLEGKPYIRG
jgi:hypothetical protein